MFLEMKNLNFAYSRGTASPVPALNDINLSIDEGQVVGIIGQTGSGKTTLVQHINGLLKADSGTVSVFGKLLEKPRDSLEIRRKVGLLFQFPEQQLFEDTVFKDISFGPKNLGMSSEKTEVRVKVAMDMVGLNFESYANGSPLELSGGEKRKVALAGVLAMEPKAIILDEPTAGLDPQGKKEIMALLRKLHQEDKKTIVMVTHSMDEVAFLSDMLVVMHQGSIIMQGSPQEIFTDNNTLVEAGLDLPYLTRIMVGLKACGLDVKENIFSLHEAEKEIIKVLGEKRI